MTGRLLIIGACLLAAGIGIAAWLASDPPQIETSGEYAPSDVPDTFDPVDPRSGNPGQTFSSADDTTYIAQEGQGKDMRRTVFSWERAEPTQGGATDVTQPRADIYLGNPVTRVVRIRADSGVFIAPEKQVRSGRFDGNVTLTLYDRPTDSPSIDLDTDRHVTYRVFLDEPARFDVDFAEVRSVGPVTVTGPDAEFTGEGLTVKFNRLRQRIEELTINQGKSLRLHRGAVDPDSPSTQPATQPNDTDADAEERSDEASGTGADTTTTNEDGDENEERGEQDPDPQGPVQFYLARFVNDVHVKMPEQDATMTGRELNLRFSLGTDRRDVEAPSSRAPAPVQPRNPYIRLAAYADAERSEASGITSSTRAKNENESGRPSSASRQPSSTRSLFTAAPDDILITWDGPLTLRPLAEPPLDLTHPDDVTLRMQGTDDAPARIVRGEQNIIAERVGFHRSTATFTAEGNPRRPAFLEDPALGTLKVQQLTIDPSTASGYATGPGTLIAYNLEEATPATQPATRPTTQPATQSTPTRGEAKRLVSASQPATDGKTTLTLDFTRRLDLQFFTADASEDADDSLPEGFTSPDRLTGLRSAEFSGDVQTRHDDFDLDTDRVALDFRQDEAGESQITTIRAVGNAKLKTKARPGQGDEDSLEPLDLSAGALTLDLDQDPESDEIIPTTLRAFRNVDAKHEKTRMTGDRLDVTFVKDEKPNADEKQSSGDEAPGIRVASITATGDVVAVDEARDTRITGQTLYALPDENRLTVIGTAEELASIRQEDLTLTGQSILLDDVSQTVRVNEAGTIDAASDPDDPSARFTVKWTRSMLIDNAHGSARFIGEVDAGSRSATDSAELATNDLTLTFKPFERDDEDVSSTRPTNEKEDETQAAPRPNPFTNVRRVVAVGGPGKDGRAVFKGQQHPTDQADKPTQRLRLEGPSMTFTQTLSQGEPEERSDDGADRPTQTLRVPGPGLLLVEDYTPADESDEDVDITGRGATLFTFKDHLLFDAAANDLTLVKDVTMVHKPLDAAEKPGEVARLWADKLVADVTETGGLTALTTDDGDRKGDSESGDETEAKPAIRTVAADGQVVIEQQNRRVTADHLLYKAINDTVELWSDGEGANVVVTDPDQPSDLPAERILWDLAKDQIKVLGARGGVTPVR